MQQTESKRPAPPNETCTCAARASTAIMAHAKWCPQRTEEDSAWCAAQWRPVRLQTIPGSPTGESLITTVFITPKEHERGLLTRLAHVAQALDGTPEGHLVKDIGIDLTVGPRGCVKVVSFVPEGKTADWIAMAIFDRAGVPREMKEEMRAWYQGFGAAVEESNG